MSIFRRQRRTAPARIPAPPLAPRWRPDAQQQPEPPRPDLSYMCERFDPRFDPCGAGPVKPASKSNGES